MTFRRNILAKLRTLLSNERTLLSYYRTSLAILGVSAFIFKFYPGLTARIFSLLLLFIAFSLSAFGTIRYFKFRDRIKKR